MKKFLTDSYVQLEKKAAAFGGKIENAPQMAEKALSRLPVKEGGAPIVFLPLSDAAEQIVKSAFGDVYKKDTNEGFVLTIGEKRIEIYADCLASKISAAYSLLAHSREGLTEGIVYSRPCVEHRSIRFYLPSREEFPFFKDFMAKMMTVIYKYQGKYLSITVIILRSESNGKSAKRSS